MRTGREMDARFWYGLGTPSSLIRFRLSEALGGCDKERLILSWSDLGGPYFRGEVIDFTLVPRRWIRTSTKQH